MVREKEARPHTAKVGERKITQPKNFAAAAEKEKEFLSENCPHAFKLFSLHVYCVK